MATIPTDAIAELRSKSRGQVIVPHDATYDEVRSIWNAMIDKRPAVIVRCAGKDDVPVAIRFARQHGLDVAIRGAGHNIAGNALCEGGLVIDHANMKGVTVDRHTKRAYVEPGATLADVDAAAQAHGLAIPVGINSTTGIAGLTLGGGFGWLTRKHGMTIDALVSADVVTADGRQLHAGHSENDDLFWALRGGGGNFGVVTRFEFQLYPVGPEVTAGLIVFPAAQSRQVLAGYRGYVESTPEEFTTWVVMRQAPPLPFLPASVHGTDVLVLAVFHAGAQAEGQKLIAPLRGWGTPVGEHIGAMPYVQWQQAFDPLLTPGARNYWKSHNFTELSDGLFDAMIEYAGTLPSPQCEIFIGLIAGAPNRVAPDAMAWGHRDAKYVLNVHGRWDTPSDDDKVIAWTRAFFKASQPFASGGAYVNFMTEDESGRVENAYGANFARLQAIKRKYDPENVFHHNQNIKA
jgi:FAD/FMN-containing dehydrogenase